MKKDEVVDLSGRRKQAKFNALMSTLDPERLFAIPMEDVDQFLDSANDSKDDPVVLGPSALLAVKRLFTKFGIDDLPETLGQLHGTINYCKALHHAAWSIPSDPKNDALWDKVVESVMQEDQPELFESFIAHKKGDLETLRRIHKERMTLAVMSRYYDPEHGWVSSRNGVPT